MSPPSSSSSPWSSNELRETRLHFSRACAFRLYSLPLYLSLSPSASTTRCELAGTRSVLNHGRRSLPVIDRRHSRTHRARQDGLYSAQVALGAARDILRLRRHHEAHVAHQQRPAQRPEKGICEIRKSVPALGDARLQGAQQVVPKSRWLARDYLRPRHGDYSKSQS